MSQSNYTREYVVQPDDQLMAIAYEQDVDYFELLALNPQYHLNPDLIKPGQIVLLPVTPEETEEEEAEPLAPVELKRPANEEGCIEGKPACVVTPFEDVLFLTQDDKSYYPLDESACQELEKEIAFVDSLMQDYRDIVANAPDSASAVKQDLIEHAKKKETWVKKADQAGAIKANTVPSTKDENLPSQDFIKASIKELGRQRELIHEYHPFFSQQSDIALKRKKLEQIDSELALLNKQLQKEPAYQKSDYKPVDQSKMAGKEITLKQRAVARYGVVEVLTVSRDRFVYVRQEFITREIENYLSKRTVTSALKDAFISRDPARIGKAILDDIKSSVKDADQEKVIAKVELKIKEWKLFDYAFFDKWKSEKSIKNDDGTVSFAANAEAQLLRFSAQASAQTDINLTEGKIDLNIGAQANFALAEGKVEAKVYVPYKKGYPVGINYEDANKKIAKVPLGCFRVNAGISLVCFVGANAGASILLSPKIGLDVNDKGGVGLKGDAFAGAQVGGELYGALEWQSPKAVGSSNFAILAKVGGGVALSGGIGASVDFQIQLKGGSFRFACSARLVFGPGAAGSFAVEVGLGKLWELAKVVFLALEVADNRKLDNVSESAFGYFYRAAYMGFALPKLVLSSVIIAGENKLRNEWAKRNERWTLKSYKIAEAKQISESIFDQKTISGISMSQLPPETIAMMLDTLVTTFVISFDMDDYRQQEQQQRAIMLLLSTGIKTWRKFEEVLVRMNQDAEKKGDKALFDNMARINSILDGEEQDSFNTWVHELSFKLPSQSTPVKKAFNIVSINKKQQIQKRELIKQQVIKLHNYKQTDELYV
ncbi:hypothetical protein OA92_08120 [Marinomonas sp. SBI22]|uniref:LysM peptidoglycan-binding domain-containing protein n=1 Tax=unclassified Marinomonas TaxID=196814 RepID=UPI0007AFBA36|nr:MULTISPECIES: LysM domain-containing protein [unclassified Marinomonas]KZM43647.1 hypothetical protein OA92_08120 [Marinomonas sp. SBI22]KZM47209.1 hypothetical protein OA91_01500 [Marinomonas sp. SBI8L]